MKSAVDGSELMEFDKNESSEELEDGFQSVYEQ